ncbi:dTDP-4-amino-4,6-dideoxygalactose transaminase [Pontibacter ummariensis]|uniref:GDP-perosamine synthase n=1 Tax=Pontibacter ummariensis TaxID=1610492 RepID=A0A239EMZ1_9BACT|nr:DegT/DnrJ/EryC1/StrS family aminotransferase [Pontibacter ummariensis]PRY13314.1 dTDP-4-amino-4,6-dideoxygalactose transaminase [Pontibacter ummariensis]SNS45244.1 dTDP-4-amino-4,6-dideoxygalactose transaminase [Pontibacter ummariensis]
MKEKIWLSSPHMGESEFKYVQEAFDTNWIAPLGPHVNGFEQDIASYLGEGVHVAALSAGTAALHLALVILGVQAGDEVICQSMTFSASANPIAYQGATPVFVDSEAQTWNMSPRYLEAAILDRVERTGKKPKAIIVVHLYGMPAQMDRIMEIANRHAIPVVEDAAEALGSSYRGQKLGTFGAMSILSFNGNKIITTSGGGALVSKNEDWVKKARFLATQARDAAPHYQHSHIGYNYRMSNVCAAIGRGQMEVLKERVEKRRNNYAFYKRSLAPYPAIRFADEPNESYYANRWLSAILVEDDATGDLTREAIRLGLEKENIESRPLWKPMHLQPVFETAPFYGDGTSERLFYQGLCLPSGSNLTEDDLNRVVEQVRGVVERTSR